MLLAEQAYTGQAAAGFINIVTYQGLQTIGKLLIKHGWSSVDDNRLNRHRLAVTIQISVIVTAQTDISGICTGSILYLYICTALYCPSKMPIIHKEQTWRFQNDTGADTGIDGFCCSDDRHPRAKQHDVAGFRCQLRFSPLHSAYSGDYSRLSDTVVGNCTGNRTAADTLPAIGTSAQGALWRSIALSHLGVGQIGAGCSTCPCSGYHGRRAGRHPTVDLLAGSPVPVGQSQSLDDDADGDCYLYSATIAVEQCAVDWSGVCGTGTASDQRMESVWCQPAPVFAESAARADF